MKLVDRIKTIDWKEFGVNHGEKIALGVVSLLVVLILFTGTRWKTFQEKQPKDLTDKVAEETQLLEAATWPASEQELYTDKYDVNSVYKNTYSIVRADDFRYPTGHPMIWSLHRRQEPIQEPTWLPVRELIATPDRFILELPPEGEEALTDGALALSEEPGQAAAADAKTLEEARLRGFAVPTAPNGGEGLPGGIGEAGPMPMGPDGMFVEGMEDGGMGQEGTGVEINARGVRFIAVRGVFPFREQIEKITQARNDPTLRDAFNLVDIRDFEIQRQKAQPGPNPWSDDDKDWTTLDKNIAYDLLAEAANYADDVVDYSNTHWVITSPLPQRLVGNWSPYFVGHPKIKTMTERQIQLRRLLNEELVRLEKEAKLADPNAIGGFAAAQRDLRELESEIGGDATQRRRLMSNLEQSLNPGDEGNFAMPAEMEGMLTSTEAPEYLLFRYLDFDVEPGAAYRYRVQLKLANPNRYELAENLASPDVGKGETRLTPWSEASPESIMTDDSKFYVKDVIAGRGRNEPSAKIDLYQWLSDVGTTANKIVEVKVGQIIGQPAPRNVKPDDKPDDNWVEVLRPYQSFEPEPIELTTKEAVVDFAVPPKTSYNYHSKLGVRELQPVSQVLVVNEYGELENRNPLSQFRSQHLAQRLLQAEYEPWEYLKHIGEEGTDDMGMGMEDMGLSDLESYGGRGKKAGGRGGAGGGRGGGAAEGAGGGRGGGANPLRRNRRGGNVSS